MNTVLYTLEVLQVITYFRKAKPDHLAVRIAVGAAFACDTLCTATIYACVYLVSFWFKLFLAVFG